MELDMPKGSERVSQCVYEANVEFLWEYLVIGKEREKILMVQSVRAGFW